MRLAILVVLVSAGVAAAEPKTVRIEGSDTTIVAAVRAGLGDRVRLVDEGVVNPAAVVLVQVRTTRRHQTATVVVTQGDGTEVGRMVLQARRGKLAAAVRRAVWRELGAAIGRAEPANVAEHRGDGVDPDNLSGIDVMPPPPPPPPAPVAEPAPAVAATVAPRRRGPPRLRVAVDERPFWRRLRYNDDLRDVTRSYDLAANAIGVELGVRPFASQPRVELAGTALVAVGVSGSRTSDGAGFATKASEWSIGAGYGGAIGAARVALRVGYGEHRFHVEDDPATGAELLPDVTYRFGRAGLDAAIAVAPRWRVLASAGGRYLLGTGDLEGADWFPRATGHGLDSSLGVSWRAARRLSLYARAEVRHYFFAMNPEPGDPMIVGGAIDTYLGGAAGAALELF